MMWKFGLILLRDIVQGNDSLVKRECAAYLTPKNETKIRTSFAENAEMIDSNINVSLDQTRKLRTAIATDPDFTYPMLDDNGYFDHAEMADFLHLLGDIFNWKSTNTLCLGKTNDTGDYTRLGWYTTILMQWIEGNGLGSFMRKAISCRRNHPNSFWLNAYTPAICNYSREQKNIVFADTLEVIEMLSFSVFPNFFCISPTNTNEFMERIR